MLAVFLPSINFRGNRSPYLWWFYKFHTEFGGQAGYLCGSEYFEDPNALLTAGRPEVNADVAADLQYRIPDKEALQRTLRAEIPIHVWQMLEDTFPSNPLEAFKYFCLQLDKVLYAAIVEAIDHLEAQSKRIDAVITCINCATLKQVCATRGIPLIHIELGPLRSPTYLQTAYFDFSGVNGGTEAKERFERWHDRARKREVPIEMDSLRALFLLRKMKEVTLPSIEVGVGLQVEDDSNILCYANNFSSSAVLSQLRKLYAERVVSAPILVRTHPASIFSLNSLPSGFLVDDSPNSVEFISRCRRLHTINSSLAVEALLLEREVVTYGESPYRFCIDHDASTCTQEAFVFFMMNYLVPWELIFDVKYIRWRIGLPEEQEIRRVHMEFYMDKRLKMLETKIAALERSLEEKERQIQAIRDSIEWRISLPIRIVFKVGRRVAAFLGLRS